MRLVTASYAEAKHIYFEFMKLFSCLVRAENQCLPLSHSSSSKSKNRKSLVISNPIPCNTAFPADHVSIHSSAENTKDAPSSPPAKLSQSICGGSSRPEETIGSSKDVNSSDSDLSSGGSNTPKRQSACDNSDAGSQEEEEDEVGAVAELQKEEEEEEEAELATIQSDDSGVGVPKSDAAAQEVISTSDSAEGEAPQDPEEEQEAAPPSEEAQPKPAPVPVPRGSFSFKEKQQESSEKENTAELRDDSSSPNPPGLLYKVQLTCAWCFTFKRIFASFVRERWGHQRWGGKKKYHSAILFSDQAVASKSHASSEDGMLQFNEGDIILVLSNDTQEVGVCTFLTFSPSTGGFFHF